MSYEIILRSAAVYTFMVIAIRLAGKKELSQLSTTDLVFIILISNAVQNAMVGDNTTLLGGIIAASTLFILNYALKLGMFKSELLKTIIEGEPVLLISDGKLLHENLKKAQITDAELEESIHEHGVENHTKVKLAILEVDGNISIISAENEKIKRTYHRRKKMHKSFAGN
jgi:uncharacterized membrane protein YcaP (DUF421 family)